jgi:hypothetical protein
MVQRFAMAILVVSGFVGHTSLVSAATSRQPPPVLHEHVALYALSGRQWKRTDLLEEGQLVRFVLVMRYEAPGWLHPRAHLAIRRTFIGGQRHQLQYGGTVFAIGMNHTYLTNGYTRFSVTVRFHSSEVLGVLLATFPVTNGVGSVTPDFLFTVRPFPGVGK